ncbi:type IV pilus modification protein PilV [Lysobacter koreensis]|uniref:Type IV pilus modification protein PilV n=1 Tax=Lysobacter koreensis TaxID=266122 RepID=A0ABW2YMS8_9GAMM
MSIRRIPSTRSPVAGFTLIEVLIAILVMAVGLLGFAMMQTMSLRFAQAANQRTQATNLAYDLLDQMRANRLVAAQYQGATFAPGAVNGCAARPVGAMTVAASIRRWQCQVVTVLGPDAQSTVTVVNGLVTVRINWGEERWNGGQGPDFAVESRL